MKQAHKRSSAAERLAAENVYGGVMDGYSIEIDEDAGRSSCGGGNVWIQAWVLVRREEIAKAHTELRKGREA